MKSIKKVSGIYLTFSPINPGAFKDFNDDLKVLIEEYGLEVEVKATQLATEYIDDNQIDFDW